MRSRLLRSPVRTFFLCASSEICRNGTNPLSRPRLADLPLMLSPLPVARPIIIMLSASTDVGRKMPKKLLSSGSSMRERRTRRLPFK